MRKLDLTNYSVKSQGAGEQTIPYDVRGSLATLLFNPSLQLRAVALLEQNKLAESILSAEGDLLLEDAQYAKVKQAVEAFAGYSQNDVELVRRVLEAPDVKIQEVK